MLLRRNHAAVGPESAELAGLSQVVKSVDYYASGPPSANSSPTPAALPVHASPGDWDIAPTVSPTNNSSFDQVETDLTSSLPATHTGLQKCTLSNHTYTQSPSSRRTRTHAPVDRRTCARAHKHFRHSCTLTLGSVGWLKCRWWNGPAHVAKARFLRFARLRFRWARLCALMCVDACRAERCGPKRWLEWLRAAYFSSRLPSVTYRNSSASLRSAHCGSASSSFSSLARPLSMVRAPTPRLLHFTAGNHCDGPSEC